MNVQLPETVSPHPHAHVGAAPPASVKCVTGLRKLSGASARTSSLRNGMAGAEQAADDRTRVSELLEAVDLCDELDGVIARV
jgi:hypothetical protein